MKETKDYFFNENLYYMALTIFNPKRLIESVLKQSSLLYGIIPFLIYITACEVGWLTAYSSRAYQAINPLPKLLPIPDEQYPLYMAIFGPFVKAAGIFIFLAVYLMLRRTFVSRELNVRPLVIFYLIVGNSLAFIAILVDQFIVWGSSGDSIRFLLSMIHPIVFTTATIYVVCFVIRYERFPLGKAIFVVIPSMILSGPVPGLLFR